MRIETIYGLKWEYKALQEAIYYVSEIWKKHIKAITILKKENDQINNLFKVNNIELVDFLFEFQDEAHKILFKRIIKELICLDPFLTRVLFYIRIPPDKVVLREFLKDNYLHEKVVHPYYLFFHDIDVLSDSVLTKSLPYYKDKPVKSIPLYNFITGKIIEFLFSTHDHYRMIDRVKQSGARESIEELRKNRINKSPEGTVWNYTPIFKKILLGNGISYIYEVFSQEEYDYLTKGSSQQFDEILCNLIRKPQPDPRPNIYFGDNLTVSDSYLIVRYGTKEEKIPCRLLPKYQNLVRSVSREYVLTDLKDGEDGDTEETQEAIYGFFNAATTWDKDKGAVPYWLERKTKWHLGEAFYKVSDNDPKTKKRKLMERIESEGGSLDEPILNKASDKNNENYMTKKDFVEDENGFLEQVDDRDESDARKKLIEKDPKMKAIFKKLTEGNPLTPAERKYKERFKKKNKR